MKIKCLSLLIMPFMLVACGEVKDPDLPPRGQDIIKAEAREIVEDILNVVLDEGTYYPLTDKGYCIVRESDNSKLENSSGSFTSFYDASLHYGHAKVFSNAEGAYDSENWYFLDKDGEEEYSLIKATMYTFGKVTTKSYINLGHPSELPATFKYDFFEEYVLEYSSWKIDLFVNALSSAIENSNVCETKSTRDAGQIYVNTDILYGTYTGHGHAQTQFQEYKPVFGKFNLFEEYNNRHIDLEFKQYPNYEFQYSVPNIHDGSWKKIV